MKALLPGFTLKGHSLATIVLEVKNKGSQTPGRQPARLLFGSLSS